MGAYRKLLLVLVLNGAILGGCTSVVQREPVHKSALPQGRNVLPPPPITEILEGEQKPSKDVTPPKLPEIIVIGKKESVTPRKAEPSFLEKLGVIFEALTRTAEWTVRRERDPFVWDDGLGPNYSK